MKQDMHTRPNTMDAAIVEEQESDIYSISKYIKNGDTVFDIGANIGAFAVYVHSLFPDSTIVCVEPMKDNFGILVKNVKSFAKVEQVALADRNGPITIFHFGKDASACHSIYQLDCKDAVPMKVRGVTLESLLNKHNIKKIDFFKLDCQGAEYIILPAISKNILGQIRFIAFELHHTIAKVGAVLGKVDDYRKKTKSVYDHLSQTHIRIQGTRFNSIQVWINKNSCSKPGLLWIHVSGFFKTVCNRIFRFTIRLPFMATRLVLQKIFKHG